MGGYAFGILRTAFGAGLAIFTATMVHATTIDVTIDTTVLNGAQAVLRNVQILERPYHAARR